MNYLFMDPSHNCNPSAINFFCYKCSANICSKCLKSRHKGHPVSAIADYKDLLEAHCSSLASSKNINALIKLKLVAIAIIDNYICKCELDISNFEKGVTEVLVQGAVSSKVASQIATFGIKSTEAFQNALNEIVYSFEKSVARIGEIAEVSRIKANQFDAIFGDAQDVSSLRAQYWGYNNYSDLRSEKGPLASIIKKLALNHNILIWNNNSNIISKNIYKLRLFKVFINYALPIMIMMLLAFKSFIPKSLK